MAASIHQLPISPHAPIYHLVPDPLFPTVESLLALSEYKPPPGLGANGPVALKEGDAMPPSMLRRSRQIRNGGGFTYTSPLPLSFPYDTKALAAEGSSATGPESIEEALAAFEVSREVIAGEFDGKSTALSSKIRQSNRFPKPTLISLSQQCHDDWLPQLELGAEGSEKRAMLVDVLAGRTVLARPGNGQEAFAPWSLCYGGHQFGSWASQLGDGRAISILSTPTTAEVKDKTGFETMELQLKGAGRTPYSRFADGLAVLRSSVREYLGAEAMAALRLPTSRALALVGLPDVKVRREMMETAAIVTRVSSSWIRIGNFEIQKSREEWESLRILTSYVARHVFFFGDKVKAPETARGLALNVLKEVSRRTAIMIGGWQAYGFMHGVMNTDNMAVNGACIDYGPYAFMDIFDPGHICNHSDEEGRYSFRNQPTMGLFAVAKLADALAEVIGCELELELEAGAAAGSGYVEAAQGWAENGVEAGKMQEWRKAGLAQLEQIKKDFIETFTDEYTRLMRLRLGFETAQQGDFDLMSKMLDLMALHSLDFTKTFRLLSQFPGSTSDPLFPKLLNRVLPVDASTVTMPPTARAEWTTWFERYAERLKLEPKPEDHADRKMRMNAVNPRFTLRQWVLEETIKKLNHQAANADYAQLERVLDMALNPFESYGETELEQDECKLEKDEDRERRRLCEVGDEEMLGFQCSCSS